MANQYNIKVFIQNRREHFYLYFSQVENCKPSFYSKWIIHKKDNGTLVFETSDPKRSGFCLSYNSCSELVVVSGSSQQQQPSWRLEQSKIPNVRPATSCHFTYQGPPRASCDNPTKWEATCSVQARK